jgi:hypothetical protein
MTLLNAEGKQIHILKDDIEDVQPGLSSMPLDLINHLSLIEMRNLIEYLAQQTDSQAGNDLEHGKK